MRVIFLALAIAMDGCTASAPRIMTPAPNPNGCFLFVYTRAGFAGTRYVINGPVRLPSLDKVGGEGDWDRRIQSLEVGSAASLAVFTDKNFSGRTAAFASATTARELSGDFARQVRSLTLSCASATR